MNQEIALELKHISKYFGSVVANKDVSLTVRKGEILSLLGENGSGKTTLMNMISGIYFPDEGQIFVNGKEIVIRSPLDAFHYGIGMVHQHFKLVDVFTAAQNIVLGVKDKKRFNLKEVNERVMEISNRYGFHIDPKKKIYDMSVSEKQTVEIVKVLYRGADLLILDEPTAVLTPQETEKLFAVLRKMKEDGKAIIIITHKLHEVLSVSDRVAVLRKGEYIGSVVTAETNEAELTEMMVGKRIELNIDRPDPVDSRLKLNVEHLTCKNKEGVTTLDDVSFKAYSGEILGIAGISGAGQKELLEAIAGLEYAYPGSTVTYVTQEGEEEELIGLSPKEIRDMGVALSFVPEDRLGMGLVGSMDMADNMMLKSYTKGKTPFVERKDPTSLAVKIMNELEVVTPGIHTPVSRLSGGNVQKVLVGREIAASPQVLMVAYPVRGLDINSSYLIYSLLNEQKQKGVSVIFVGEDLDVLIALCDRIMVLASGKITGIVDGRTATKEGIGLLMTKNEAMRQEDKNES
ncbi:MAG: ABC transporter ATP-binding protein [Clostridia bacterium]|nr:ABC transporter ATP-binding protein [Clostridia bacterium]